MRWMDAVRARLRLLFGRGNEARFDEEIRLHVDMEAEHLMRTEGLSPAEARRRALVAFGGVERVREELRSGRGLDTLRGLSLDLRLGLRMMRKNPGLTVVGTVGMAVAIAIGAATFAITSSFVEPRLPLEDGDRIVALQNFDASSADQNHGRTHLHDLEVWQEALPALEELGAYRVTNHNLLVGDGVVEPVRVAELTASGFRLAGVPPLLGRWILEEDERSGAAPVVVIGEPLWRSRFGSDPDIVGRSLRLGATPHTVVGVMPASFAFPVNNRVWTPFLLKPSDYAVGAAPPVDVFGRLAPGADLADAQAQLDAVGRRQAVALPATHASMQPRVMAYGHRFLDAPTMAWAFYLLQLLVSLILVVIGINVAALVYARTATRTGEIAVRTALGASRRRVIAQLFAEALVLSGAAALVGLAAAHFALVRLDAFLAAFGGEQVPFWWRFELSAGTALYGAGLAVLAAVIVGVVPALKVTGARVQGALKIAAAGGSGLRLGRTWTTLIVAQVAIAVAVLPLALRGVSEWIRIGAVDPGFAAEALLTASLQVDAVEAGTGAPVHDAAGRFGPMREDLAQRLEAEPGIRAVVYASDAPGAEQNIRIQVDEAEAPRAEAAARSYVDADLFDVFDVPLLAGRSFGPADLVPGAATTIVSRSFVERLFGSGNALGRRIREVPRGSGDDEPEPGPWLEIVGVVDDFPAAVGGPAPARMYRPLRPGSATWATLFARMEGSASAAIAPRIQELALGVDPTLRVANVATMEQALRQQRTPVLVVVVAFALISGSGLLLSAAGISALMSFTVARRRREIGIRSALGARPGHVLGGVLARALRQIGIGVLVGVGLAALVDRAASGEILGPEGPWLLLGAAALMAAVGSLAAVAPARRGLRIQPTEALRAE